ncbi:hypothetical protein BU17DRAFT_68861 [Hysterangium stoloniferum]|nr:hypothetical protein BU17DRAFT_68861 [Hysterangium stoloniferum]
MCVSPSTRTKTTMGTGQNLKVKRACASCCVNKVQCDVELYSFSQLALQELCDAGDSSRLVTLTITIRRVQPKRRRARLYKSYTRVYKSRLKRFRTSPCKDQQTMILYYYNIIRVCMAVGELEQFGGQGAEARDLISSMLD